MNISVVVPVYNSADTLHLLVEELGKVLPAVAQEFELVLVNDGSPDDSWRVVEQLAGEHCWVRGVDLMRNYGQHNAVLCGIREARYEVIVTMDDDLQHPPVEIPALLEKFNEGYDVVYGIPKKMPHSWWRNAFSVLTKYAVSYVMGFKTVRDISSFRVVNTSIRKAFETYAGPEVLVDVLFSWGTSRFTTVYVEEAPRKIGKSNYSFGKLVRVAFLVLTSYTTMPLRFASLLGFLFTIIGFFIFIYVLTMYFKAGSIPGFPFIASTVVIFSGIQLFALGVIGEYLARVFERLTGKPTYKILRTAGGNRTDQP
jgi:undecaprenyl-phosphate 4-deoxy-4-formamido-L-arabinose transferase